MVVVVVFVVVLLSVTSLKPVAFGDTSIGVIGVVTGLVFSSGTSKVFLGVSVEFSVGLLIDLLSEVNEEVLVPSLEAASVVLVMLGMAVLEATLSTGLAVDVETDLKGK